jgi:hypothetical protein
LHESKLASNLTPIEKYCMLFRSPQIFLLDACLFMPFCSSKALELEQSIIRKYGDFLHRIRDKDDITYHTLREILEDEIRRESEIESVLAVDGKRYSHKG